MPRYSPPPPWPPMPRKLGPSAPGPLSLPLSPRIVPRASPLDRAPSTVVRGPWPPPRRARALELEPSSSGPRARAAVRGPCASVRVRGPCAWSVPPWPSTPAPRPRRMPHGPRPGVESRHRFPPCVVRGPRRAPREPGAEVAKALARIWTNIYRSKVNWLVIANVFHVKHPRHFAKSKWPVFL
jgi:hypothetical protein